MQCFSFRKQLFHFIEYSTRISNKDTKNHACNVQHTATGTIQTTNTHKHTAPAHAPRIVHTRTTTVVVVVVVILYVWCTFTYLICYATALFLGSSTNRRPGTYTHTHNTRARHSQAEFKIHSTFNCGLTHFQYVFVEFGSRCDSASHMLLCRGAFNTHLSLVTTEFCGHARIIAFPSLLCVSR